MNIGGLWATLTDAVCRPPRDTYQVGELVGGRRGYCRLQGQTVVREDVVLVNKRGQKLQCSHYKPSGAGAEHALPVVVYCHCNSGSRRDAEEAFYVLLPHNITVFCLDFAGSGLSDGEWVTLGAHEVDDLEAAVTHLRAASPSSTIGLWGRSMGAVTALLYSARDPSIAGVVMDSPFARLTELMVELVEEQRLPIPRPLMRVALGMMRRSVRRRAGFDIDAVAPLDAVPRCHIPALFGHATEDTFVCPAHSRRLHDAYAGGDKSLVTFRGDHNSVRPASFYSAALLFLHTALRCPDTLPQPPTKAQPLSKAPSSVAGGVAGSEAPPQLSRAGSEAAPQPRELAPPWDRERARAQTEQQLARLQCAASPAFKHRSTPSDVSAVASEAAAASTGEPEQHWLDLEPPASSQRAPWLQPAGASPVAPERAESAASALASAASLRTEPAARGGAADVRRASAAQPPFSRPPASSGPATASSGVSGMSEEDRFWHLQPGTDLLTTEEEEELMARALELSMRETNGSGLTAASTPAAGAATPRLEELVPDRLRNISHKDAEEMMLAEAIKASLLDAQQAEAPPGPASGRAPVGGPGADKPQDGKAAGRKGGRSLGGFWRRREPDPPARPASKGVTHT